MVLTEDAQLRFDDGRVLQYQIKLLPRGRHLRLRVTRRGQLVVSAPAGVSRQTILSAVVAKRAWIARQLQALTQDRAVSETLPEKIILPAIGETWRVVYHAAPRAGVSLRIAHTMPLAHESHEKLENGELILRGAVDCQALCEEVLRKWLLHHAKTVLTPALQCLSESTSLSYLRLRVKNQRSRWGSCSPEKVISLNSKLLFLPVEWMHYVMIHELCHTVEMNHSAHFWRLVARHCPDYAALRYAMRRNAHCYIPPWAYGRHE